MAVVDLNMANAEDTVKQIQDKRGKAKVGGRKLVCCYVRVCIYVRHI